MSKPLTIDERVIQLPCNCGDPFHSLNVYDADDLEISIVLATPSTLSQRISAAWRILRKDMHTLNEVHLSRHNVEKLISFSRVRAESAIDALDSDYDDAMQLQRILD